MKKIFAVLAALFILVIMACSGGDGGSSTPTSNSSALTYVKVTDTSTPVLMAAALKDGSESLMLVGNKDASGNPTSINGIGYSSSTKGQLYFVIDTSSGLPTLIVDSLGNKIILSNYTATSVQMTVYNNNILVSGPSQISLDTKKLSKVQSLWSDLNSSSTKSSSLHAKAMSTSNGIWWQYVSLTIDSLTCAIGLAGSETGVALVLVYAGCGSVLVSALELKTGYNNKIIDASTMGLGVTSCGFDISTREYLNAALDCTSTIDGLIGDVIPGAQSPLPVPSGLTLIPSSTQMNLSWNASIDNRVVGYNVYRFNPSGVFSKILNTTQTTAIDSNLLPSAWYCYLVSAYDSSGNESFHSSEVCETTSSAASTMPTFLNNNFLNNGASTTSSKILTANISVVDSLGITAYSICPAVDTNGCEICSLTPPNWHYITQTNNFTSDLSVDFTSYTLTDGQTLSVYIEVEDSKGNTNYSCDQITYTGSSSSYNISGQVTLNGTGLAGVTVTLTGTGPGSATTDSSGNYSFSNVANGSYTVTPSKTGYTFSPTNRTANVSGANFIVPNFVAIANSAPQVSITANPTRVPAGGGNSTISWSASNVNSCIVSGPGLSSTNLSGSQEVSISTQSTYTITCQTNNSPITQSVIVNIAPIFGEF